MGTTIARIALRNYLQYVGIVGELFLKKALPFEKVNSENYRSKIKDLDEDVPNKLYSKYADGTYEYDEVIDAIKKYSKFVRYGDYDSYKELEEKMDDVAESRIAYDNGDQYKADGDYQQAIAEYEQVSWHDEKNYNSAQRKIKNCQEEIKKGVIPKLEECKTANDYKSALDLIESLKEYLRKDEELEYYKKYFTCLKTGENALKNGYKVSSGASLYTDPNEDSYYGRLSSGGQADVYEYLISDDNECWMKIKVEYEEDGKEYAKYFWIRSRP